MVIGIDASRIRSGGAVAHIVGILNEFDYQGLEITEVHVWSYKLLLNKLPNNSWLKKHNPKATEKNILHQIFWQIFNLPKEFKKNQCNILFNIDAGTFCRIQPCVTLSQDLLSFEKGEMNRYGISLARLRLIILKYIQAYNLKKANGTIFLTKYAAKIVENFTGNILNKLIVPHGVSDLFFNESFVSNIPLSQLKEIKCIYVSNTAPYKHQWNVVKAIHQLKQKGYPVSLLLIGGGKGQAQKKLEYEMSIANKSEQIVIQAPFIAHAEIPKLLSESDIFIFASSCENMPVTLIEGMASSKPIACSNRGPMPEILKNAGVYFDPEQPNTIAKAIENIILDEELKNIISKNANMQAMEFTWKKCSLNTFNFIKDTSKSLVIN